MVLDVLRGVAVGGILLANTFVFFGLFLIPPERAAAFGTHSLDRVVEFAEHVLVEGKFYSIFSLLFGIGFGLQLTRGGDASVSRFRRRLRVLLLIGAVHALLIWAGDILLLYALLGFSMPWFAKKDARSLLRWTIGLLATPTILYTVALIVLMLAGSSPAPPGPARPDLPPEIFERLAAMGTGGFADALIGNLMFFVGRWMDLFVSVRFPKVLGMFVLGLWTVRQGITTDLQAHLPLLRRWRATGWTIGLAANVMAALAFLWSPDWPPFPRRPPWRIRAGGRFPAAGPRLRLHHRDRLASRAACSGSVRPGGTDGFDELSDALRRMRHALVWLRAGLVVADWRGYDVGGGGDDCRPADSVEPPLACVVSVRSRRVALAPFDLRRAAADAAALNADDGRERLTACYRPLRPSLLCTPSIPPRLPNGSVLARYLPRNRRSRRL